ncbi:MAG TPA: 30S ribosomal protein S8e [Candidatus Woesearchaeota archaeon]|nr:30S ribosomal protein S8e [Candidatus Woesearchaeota archaeon]
MTIIQYRSKRKVSSGRYKKARKNRAYEKGREPTFPKVSKDTKIVSIRTRGGNIISRLLRTQYANVVSGKDSKKVKILNVLETPANRNYQIRNILTKGAVIETELGKAKITSRPGQEGSVDAVLIEKK